MSLRTRGAIASRRPSAIWRDDACMLHGPVDGGRAADNHKKKVPQPFVHSLGRNSANIRGCISAVFNCASGPKEARAQ